MNEIKLLKENGMNLLASRVDFSLVGTVHTAFFSTLTKARLLFPGASAFRCTAPCC